MYDLTSFLTFYIFRDLNDRQKWQIPMAKDLVNFCISANPPFPNQQMIQSHADIMRLSTSTFKALFEYLIQFVMPDYTVSSITKYQL